MLENNLNEHHLDYSGQVTSVIINLNDDPQICLFGNDQFTICQNWYGLKLKTKFVYALFGGHFFC